MSHVTVRASTPEHWRDARALLHDHVAWMRAALGLEPLDEQPALREELDALHTAYACDDAAVFLVTLDGATAGMVAVRCHPDGTAELKRMYVRPVARGLGLADALVTAAVRFAEARGSRSMWLETSRDVMGAAIAVYRRHGFDDTGGPGRTLQIDGLLVMERPLVRAPCRT